MDPANDPGTPTSERQAAHRNKVERVIGTYGLDGLGDELERRWLGIDSERQSLRKLTDVFNQRVLYATLNDADGQTIDGEVKNLYRLLKGDGVSTSARTQAETKLSRFGIDVESLRQDFVSHQTIHTYLTDVREARLPEDEPSADAATQSRQETILRLRNRLVAVIERSLESLRDAGHLSLGSFDAMVSATVYCTDCEKSYDIADLLRRRACECAEEAD